MQNRDEIFKIAVRENERRIYGICCHYFGPGDDAKDAFQEILLKVWLNLPGFRQEAKLSTWISRIAVNVCLTFVTGPHKKHIVLAGENFPVACDQAEEAETDNSLEEEKLAFFKEFTAGLNPVDKSLVSLYLEDLDYREISQITGLSEVNARTRIHRIKGQIKKEWEEKHGTR